MTARWPVRWTPLRGSRTIGGNVAAAWITQCDHGIGLSAATLVRHGGSISAGRDSGLVNRHDLWSTRNAT